MIGLVKPITLLYFDASRRTWESLIEGIDRVWYLQLIMLVNENIPNKQTDWFSFLCACIHDDTAGGGNRWGCCWRRSRDVISPLSRTLLLSGLGSRHVLWHHLWGECISKLKPDWNQWKCKYYWWSDTYFSIWNIIIWRVVCLWLGDAVSCVCLVLAIVIVFRVNVWQAINNFDLLGFPLQVQALF